jgi:CheY-like chemotaxis protein
MTPIVEPASQSRPVTLPLRDGAVLRPGGVLVVDDEENVRRVLGLGMRAHGFAVWLATDGSQAVEMYRSHRDAIDVVLLDVQMPTRDGPLTLAALREIDPELRCCFMTGDPGRYTEQVLRDLGATAIFWKPFRMSEVAQQIERLVAQPGRDKTSQDDR